MSAFSGVNIKKPQRLTNGTLAFAVIATPILEVDEAGGLCQLITANGLTNDIAFKVSKVSVGVNGISVACPAGWTVNGVLNTPKILEGSQDPVTGTWEVYTDIANLRIIARLPGLSQDGGGYVPALATSAGAVAAVGIWAWSLINGVVTVLGSFSQTIGVNTVITFTLPPTAQPAANFAAMDQIIGLMQADNNVEIVVGTPSPVPASKLGTVAVTVAGASGNFNLMFRYSI